MMEKLYSITTSESICLIWVNVVLKVKYQTASCGLTNYICSILTATACLVKYPLSWVNYLIDIFGSDIEIVLDGISMGATTVLMASALDLPSNVKGVIADCGFTSPWDIVTHVAKHDMHIPKFPLLYLMIPTVRLLCGFGLKAESTVNAVRKHNLPILYVHGLDDDFVPHEMSAKAYNARPENSRLVSVEGAAHGLSYVVDEKTCQKELHDFFEATEKGHF